MSDKHPLGSGRKITWTIPVPGSVREAIRIQENLKDLVSGDPDLTDVRLIAGTDASYSCGMIHAAAVLVHFPGLSISEVALSGEPVTFPYIPGLFAFREGPALLHALSGLESRPDLILVNGHGIAHPRRFGIASYIGLVTGIPAIGISSTLLIGETGPLCRPRGSGTPVVADGDFVGTAVRTKTGVRPVYVSYGHRIDTRRSVEWVLRTAVRYRMPEPLRMAHIFSGIPSRTCGKSRPAENGKMGSDKTE